MRNPLNRGRGQRGREQARTPLEPVGPRTVPNPHRRVAVRTGDSWTIAHPPAPRMTGRTATGAQIREWARANRMELTFGVDPDLRFAQIEAASAVDAALWLKRFNADTGYSYQTEARDCDNFARRFRAFPDIFGAQGVVAQAAVFGIYADMDEPFAGVADSVHALNAAWTDAGVYVFEPQGIDITYQRLEDWPNHHGISVLLLD